MKKSKNLQLAVKEAIQLGFDNRNDLVTPEHLLYAISIQDPFVQAADIVGLTAMDLTDRLWHYIEDMYVVPEDAEYNVDVSGQFSMAMSAAELATKLMDQDVMDVPQVVLAIRNLEESEAAYCLQSVFGGDWQEFVDSLMDTYGQCQEVAQQADGGTDSRGTVAWRQFVTCLNDTYTSHNPLIGREEELERTIRVLCRKEKNNPLHVGEAGVGKTALVYGLTALVERGEVPERLKGAHVYMMDMGSMLAGTQFRGDFEKRVKMVMEGLAQEGNAILYIDEIHNLVGAGRNGDSSLDASNLLKPYLESGTVRFIGSTTYDEYNRYIAKQKSLVRRFQQIDIAEPSVEQTVEILGGLLPGYEKFHGVKYAKGAVEYAVRATARYITDRFLPDKAIDLIDEAGAYRETHPLTSQKRQTVDRRLLGDVMARMCKIDAKALSEEGNDSLATLADDIKRRIFGQDKAVDKVVEAVQMAKAGLADDRKPMACLLFVGPTGVGKTEVARVLASRLGVSMVRFDMSEYAEKHTVAKLIGSPAGYVGYEDGGLLTAAIRKSPNCVLLFDEIEKAHPDIYNIFLQMMDYASLTDSRGQKADFRNVVIIMTSNAGAQYASHASIGFGGGVPRGEAMLTQVKKTFKPEFINRLSDIVVFADLSRDMATRILDKCLGELRQKLDSKKVALVMADEAKAWLLDKGFSAEYGARQLERVVNAELKPMLMRAILFGKLARGGEARVTLDGDKLLLEC